MKNQIGLQITDRRFNYDALRIASTLAVILIHVNWKFFSARSETPSTDIHYIVESIINIITRFSVPCFVMISGAFNLNNKENSHFSDFYRKVSWKIFIPLFGAGFISAIIEILLYKRNVLQLIRSTIIGVGVISWFMYMLAGIYILTPFIIRLKSVINDKVYISLAFLMTVWATGSQAISSQKTPYAIGVVFAYLSYYLMGDVILNFIHLKCKSIVYFLVAISMFFLSFIARYVGVTYYLSNPYTNFFSPFIVIASLCIFAGVKVIDIKWNLTWLSKKTFYIFIFHSIINDVLFDISNSLFGNTFEFVQLLIITVVTFMISLAIAIVYDIFWSRRNAWKEKWYALGLWKKLNSWS